MATILGGVVFAVVLVLLFDWRPARTSVDLPARLLGAITRRLPADRAEWGEAMLGELEQVRSRGARWRFALGCAVATLLFPAPRNGSAGWPLAVVSSAAVGCAGLVAAGMGRYPAILTAHGTWPVLALFAAVLLAYTAGTAIALRRGAPAVASLASGLGLAAVWAIAGVAAVSHPAQPLYSLLLLAIPVAAAAVGGAAGWRRGSGAAGRQVARLASVVGGLGLFLVLGAATLLTAGGPYDAGQLRDFPGSGLPDMATYAVSDSLGTAMMLLVMAPALTAAVGTAAATITGRIRRAA
ncbi:MAG: hypothetical protein JWO79_3674 [Actinomycetia bacterium]|nr:hypothetical protein [Actinomycetes bacterium]